MKVQKQLRCMMLKSVSSKSVVGVEILLAVGDSARRQSKCIEF